MAPKQHKSPLRYPGGKTRAIPVLESFVSTHFPGRTRVLSPFFGGGSFELYLKSKGYTIVANDLFHPLYTFWKVVQTRRKELLDRIHASLPITKEWFQATRKDIYSYTDEVEIASAYYCINRTSFSGATFCGGFSKQAAEGRLTPSSLETLGAVDLSNITFTNEDCISFLASHPETETTLVYADPPYYISSYVYGKNGDMHEGFNHEAFAAALRSRKDWILSYNDCDYIRELYAGCRFFSVSWAYGMNASKASSELLILPPPS